MSDFGLSETGFKRKRLDQLLNELNLEVQSIFGTNFNVSPESPDGQINGIVSESNANLWEVAENAYNAFNPSAATNASLSNLVLLNGISRLPATFTRAELTLTGISGTLIPSGSLVSTNDTLVQFATEEDATIEISGTTLVFASCLNSGPILAVADTITEIDNPINGWTAVTNIEDGAIGTDEETDAELRSRRDRSVARDSQAQLDSIYSAVANTDGVTHVVVLENDTNIVDSNGLPPHSFRVIVIGGVDEEIGNTIWLKKPAGITTSGNTTVQILDYQGFPHDMLFSRPTAIDIFMEVDLTTNGDYPTDGDNLIKQAIVDYANGDLVSGRGFSLGDNVIYTRLYTPINSVVGHEIDDIRIGLSASPTGTDNIVIALDEISRFTVSNIVINS